MVEGVVGLSVCSLVPLGEPILRAVAQEVVDVVLVLMGVDLTRSSLGGCFGRGLGLVLPRWQVGRGQFTLKSNETFTAIQDPSLFG